MFGIFTLLYDVSYLPGSLLLGSVLKEMIGPDTKLGILIDKLVFNAEQLKLIEDLYDDLVEVSMIETSLVKKLVEDLKRPELDKTFSKIHLWSLEKYETILYLDSDTLPNKDSNLLNLLKLEFSKGKILASPDSGFPDVFNSGMFLMKPSLEDFNNLTDLVNSKAEVSFDGADQGLLNQYFNSNPDWVEGLVTKNIKDLNVENLNNNWVKLPFLYNVTPSTQYQYLPAYNYFSSNKLFPTANLINPPEPIVTKLESEDKDSELFAQIGYNYTSTKHFQNQVKLIHFIGPYKPWNYPHSPSHLEWWSLWNKYYGQSTLDLIHKPKVVDEKVYTETETHTKPLVYSYTSKDSLWDPSSSSPPKTSSENVSSFKPSKFVNRWDKTSSPPKGHVQFEESENIKQLEKESKFGHHYHQKAERSFDVTQDYIMLHPMISKLKSSTEQSKPSQPVQQSKSDIYSKTLDISQVNDKLDKFVLDKSNQQ